MLSTDSVERLPVFNKTTLRHYKLSLEADDWCIPSKEPLDLAVYRAAKWFSHGLTWPLTQTFTNWLKCSLKAGHCGTGNISPPDDGNWSDQKWPKRSKRRPSFSVLIVWELPWLKWASSSCNSSCFLYMCAIDKGREEQVGLIFWVKMTDSQRCSGRNPERVKRGELDWW